MIRITEPEPGTYRLHNPPAADRLGLIGFRGWTEEHHGSYVTGRWSLVQRAIIRYGGRLGAIGDQYLEWRRSLWV